MAFKSLLLDIDGVIVRDRLLMEHVRENCVRYVANRLPDCKDPRETNRVLYLGHGHTARGLSRCFQMDTSDFNEKVYDKHLMDHLADVIYGNEFQQEAKELHELTEKDWKVTLFTNSPVEWAVPIARAISDNVFVDCVGHNVNRSFLKPEVMRYLQFPSHMTHLYVDDSLKNLGTARSLPNWHPIYFNEGPKDHHLWCPQISSIWELILYVNSVDQWIQDVNLSRSDT
jgi:FMN phosphatase YigB (HAD superfamily)